MAQEKACIYCNKKFIVSKNHDKQVYTCAICEKHWREFEESYYSEKDGIQESEK